MTATGSGNCSTCFYFQSEHRRHLSQGTTARFLLQREDLSVPHPVHPSIKPPIPSSIYSSIHLFLHQAINLPSIHPSIHPSSTSQSIHSSIPPSVIHLVPSISPSTYHPFIHPVICSSIYLKAIHSPIHFCITLHSFIHTAAFETISVLIRLSILPSIQCVLAPSYLLQLSAPGSHEHHRVLSVGVRRHGAHALGAVLVQRVALDDPQASQRLVQHQAAKIISDLLRLWAKIERRVKVRQNCGVDIFLGTHFGDEGRRKSGRSALRSLTHIQSWGKKKGDARW